jgi:hypothetical protein
LNGQLCPPELIQGESFQSKGYFFAFLMSSPNRRKARSECPVEFFTDGLGYPPETDRSQRFFPNAANFFCGAPPSGVLKQIIARVPNAQMQFFTHQTKRTTMEWRRLL